ncbi:hypothetical protein OS493_010886 [Desmophyllum pertusum]|uniref:HEPN domain-containing protein n=1 Tax=Desmophyllum pertusum TaxID=174260 RepID=A0A9X0CYF8_9CNID|nr:hypothetical protein OS493_010886 [Desmophyllum pertusum]
MTRNQYRSILPTCINFTAYKRYLMSKHSKQRKQAVFDEISVVLEDAWKLPEEQRTQIVKRLILRWCPEKNLGDEEFCSEAAEKALKAAQYTVDVEKTNYHDLVQNCNDLNDSELTNLASQLERLVGGSARMRYPDRMCFPQIPNEVYSEQMAQQALQLAKKIIARVKNRIT